MNRGRSIQGTADEGQATRYAALAQRLAQGIHDGALPIGDRLPSIRQLCQGQGVSPATATHALRMLEDAGLVEARPREGYFVRSRTHRPVSPRDGVGLRPQPMALSDKRMLMLQFTQAGATDPLGVLTIGPQSRPIRQVQKIMIELARHQPELLIDWGSYKGDLRLRQRIAQRALEWGGSFSADDVIITHGNVEADTMCLGAVTRPGDTVAVPGPSHFCLLEQLDALQLKMVEIPTDAHHGMSVDALAAVLERQTLAACLLASFRDPMGSLMPEAEKLRLVQLLARHARPSTRRVTCSITATSAACSPPICALASWWRSGTCTRSSACGWRAASLRRRCCSRWLPGSARARGSTRI